MHASSVNLLTNYGGVMEIHEARGGVYNNLFGPVYVAAGAAQGAAGRAEDAGRAAPALSHHRRRLGMQTAVVIAPRPPRLTAPPPAAHSRL